MGLASLVLSLVLGPAAAGPAPAPAPGGAPVVWPEHRETLEVLPDEQLDIDEARRLFAAGKQAAEGGRWDEAIRYFAEAYRHSGSPGQLYSLGRGHRELYFHQGRDPVQLRLALLRFRQYLERSPDGRNRDNARRYIEELQPYATVLEGFDEPAVITRLMVYSPVDAATVSVDGAEPRAAPVTLDVEPGSHRVEVRAPGYDQAVRVVEIPAGATVPLELPLEARPAVLRVRGPDGAELFIDGQPRGRLPVAAPVALPAGSHQVAVAQRGRTPFVRELELARGGEQQLEVTLPMTGQRKASFVAMGLGAASLLAAGTLTGLALRSQALAREIERERRTAGIDQARYEQGQRAWRRRDTLRAGAITTGVLGGLALGTGLVLYFVDTSRGADRRSRPQGSGRRSHRLAAVPAGGRGWAGTALAGRF